MKNELEKFVAENREAFDDRMPGADVLARIQQRMGHTEATPAKKGIVVSFRTIRWAAAACVVVMAGLGIWWMNLDSQQDQVLAGVIQKQQESKVQDTKEQETENKEIGNQGTEELSPAAIVTAPTASFVAKVDQRKEMLFANLGNMESASTRIAAAMKAYDMKNADRDIVDALFHTMNNDPNTNVRLAALEAIAKFHRESYVRKKLTAALKKQKDPIVQVELIQVLTKMKQTSILGELEKLVKDVNTDKEVKDRAYASLLTLGS